MTNEINTINDLMPNSHDWNAERLAQLKAIMPDLFNLEGQLNPDELKKLIDPQLVQETERYEFRWFGKSNAKRNAFSPSNATLNFEAKRSLNPQNTQNLMIEGDNLEVLKLLSTAYREQVKMIYIDPPYNTGKDFVYSDNFTQEKAAYWQDAEVLENGVKVDTNSESDGRYHSNWLNMMFSRLLIARQLLRDDGVIFISIDDNEQANLKKLCDEVFGEDNFVANFIWQHRKSSQNDVDVSLSHNYTFCYAKNRSEFALNPLKIDDEKFSNPDNDYRGDWVADPLDAPNIRPNLTYPITNPNTGEQHLPPSGRHWRFSQEKFASALRENRIIFGKTGKSRPQYKRFKSEAIEKGTNPFTIWTEMGTATEATKELMGIFDGKKFFDTPKPVRLINEILQLTSGKDEEDIILDFFAGSGTTAQAVMELNLEDGGNRQYICVQLPEATDENSEAYKAGYKKISDITIARAAKVIDKLAAQHRADKPEQVAGLGFKVFKLVKSNFPRVAFAPDVTQTDAENIALLQQYIKEKEAQLSTLFNAEALMTEVLLKNGFTLNYTLTPQPQFTQNKITQACDGNKTALLCLDDSLQSETVAYFVANVSTKFICLERALDTTKKYNLKHSMGDQFIAF